MMDISISQLATVCGWIATIAGAAAVLWKIAKKPFDRIEKKLDGISKRLDDNDDSTSTLMLEKMMWAYHFYVLDDNPIPLDVKTALETMYDKYVENGRHNHVPGDFKDGLARCRIK